MKNVTIILGLILAFGLPLHSQAQFVKGDNVLSGTFNLNTNSVSLSEGSSVINGPKTTNVNIAVGGMRIISDNSGPGALGLGVQLSLMNTANTQVEGGTTITQSSPTFEIAPFARSYFTNTETLGIFAEGVTGFSFGKEKIETKTNSGTNSSEVNTSGFRINIKPGLTYSITNKIGLDFLVGSLGYQSESTQYSSDSKETQSDFGIRFDLSTIQVGISLKI